MLKVVAAAVVAAAAGCGGMSPGGPMLPSGPAGAAAPDAGTAPAGTSTVMVAAAGDVSCDGCDAKDTAALLEQALAAGNLAAILPLGDLAYPDSTLAELHATYAPTWGRPELLALERPALGNHEYAAGDVQATGYFDYFMGAGVETGARGAGYYSYDLGGWHLIALNTSDGCNAVSCAAGSPQEQWLRADLAAHARPCTLAYWHIPRFQAGTRNHELAAADPLWKALYDAGVDLVLVAHEHNFQALVPLDRDGQPDPARGMRSFVVGTGGGALDHALDPSRSDLVEASVTNSHGILELELGDGRYGWRFVPVAGAAAPTGAAGGGSCR
jgi:hypothetical protein